MAENSLFPRKSDIFKGSTLDVRDSLARVSLDTLYQVTFSFGKSRIWLENLGNLQFKEHNIDFYDEMYDLGREILKNARQLCEKYSRYRWFDKLSLNGHISVTPPLPYKFHIHQEGLEKIWSSVTYITPDKNVGTKMYTKESADSFVREAQWRPNNTFIFCGEAGRTWHSYESGAETNRITLNFFLMKDSPKNYLRHGDV